MNATSSSLDLGVVGLSTTRHVALRVRNPNPRPLCVTRLDSELPGAQLALDACAHLKPKPVPADHACVSARAPRHPRARPRPRLQVLCPQRCVAAGGEARAALTVVAPARRGMLRGVVALQTPLARLDTAVALRAEPGRVAALPFTLDPAAPVSAGPGPSSESRPLAFSPPPLLQYAWAEAELVVDSTMEARMRVLDLVHGGDGAPDLAVEFV